MMTNLFILNLDTFQANKHRLDGVVFWKQVDDKIEVKAAMPVPGLITFLKTL